MDISKSYRWLKDHSIQTSYLGSTGELIAWDQRTYIPAKGHAHRAEQLAALAVLLHERATDHRIGDRLSEVENSELTQDPSSIEATNIREWRRLYDRATKIPADLAAELARATAKGESAWEQARPNNDWSDFKPHLNNILSLLRDKAAALGYQEEPYDALVEDYEPGETAASLEVVFKQLRDALVPLIDGIRGCSHQPDTSVLSQDYPVAGQERFVRRLASDIGYDFDAGRLDVSAHPFTIGIGPGDIRITTRYAEDYLNSAVFGTIHEAGHAMYEQGLPEEHWGTPAGQATSLGIHESQSRLWENFVARSTGFWRYALPLARAEFNNLDDTDLADFVRAINKVEPSLIRVEADEVTYNLHIMLRFELELALLRGTLSVDDLPEAWNDKMSRYLGLTPTELKDGAMQDVHWSAGLVGYFPTYTLGNIYAAQIFAAAKKEIGDVDAMIGRGEFDPLLSWLRSNVHCAGSIYGARDLVKKVTGSPPDPQSLIDYCEDKFKDLYRL
jgi:carboxypeptidase Taq